MNEHAEECIECLKADGSVTKCSLCFGKTLTPCQKRIALNQLEAKNDKHCKNTVPTRETHGGILQTFIQIDADLSEILSRFSSSGAQGSFKGSVYTLMCQIEHVWTSLANLKTQVKSSLKCGCSTGGREPKSYHIFSDCNRQDSCMSIAQLENKLEARDKEIKRLSDNIIGQTTVLCDVTEESEAKDKELTKLKEDYVIFKKDGLDIIANKDKEIADTKAYLQMARDNYNGCVEHKDELKAKITKLKSNVKWQAEKIKEQINVINKGLFEN